MKNFEHLKKLTSKVSKFDGIPTDYFWVPIGWNHDSSYGMFPLPKDHAWKSLTKLFKDLEVTEAVCYFAPVILQLEVLMHRSARAHGVPIIEVAPGNTAMLIEYAKHTPIDVIVTTKEQREEIESISSQFPRPPKAIVVIGNEATDLTRWNTSTLTIHEIHLVPGLPLFWQDSFSALSVSENLFKQSDAFSWEMTENSSLITSDKFAVPIDSIDTNILYKKTKNPDYVSIENSTEVS